MVEVRKMVADDSEEVWPLMLDLAIFEHYIDSFAITPEIVRHAGFEKENPDFYCFVATDGPDIVGMLVYYYLPYTAQNRPDVYIKELYIDDEHRGQGVGTKLMTALKDEAKSHNVGTIKWTVAPWNTDGQKFYKNLGAKETHDWLDYKLDL